MSTKLDTALCGFGIGFSLAALVHAPTSYAWAGLGFFTLALAWHLWLHDWAVRRRTE